MDDNRKQTDVAWVRRDAITRRERVSRRRFPLSAPYCGLSSSGGAAPAQAVDAGGMASRRGVVSSHRPVTTGVAQNQRRSPVPIWLAALSATGCLATRNGEGHEVSWDCVEGRALYTNSGADSETIQPLGVSLAGGETLSVYWMPGETGYTVEVYGRNELAN